MPTQQTMQATDESGKPVDLSVLEESETAFDPTTQHLDLTKEEKRRTTALMMAIQAYRELIIKEAAYLKEAADLARRDEGPRLRPATIDAMVEAAFKFDCFISGRVGPVTTQEADEEPAEPVSDRSVWVMTEDWFLENYWKLLSLQKALGELPEVQEIIDEGRAAGLDVDALIKRPSPPEIYLWL